MVLFVFLVLCAELFAFVVTSCNREYYIPNTANIHSVDSSDDVEVPNLATVAEREREAYREMEEREQRIRNRNKKQAPETPPLSAASDTAANSQTTKDTEIQLSHLPGSTGPPVDAKD